MARIRVRYNPYLLKTNIQIDGKNLTEKDSILQYVQGKRLQEWIGDFPKKLREECNTRNFEIKFYGLDLDWDDFKYGFEEAVNNKIIDSANLKLIKGKKTEDIENKIVEIFNDLQNGPIDDFKTPQLTESFKRVQEEIFPINVIATMSAGKSTLINALLSNKLMPSKNEACTATITRITDNGNPRFTAIVYDKEGQIIDNIDDLDYETMEKLNSNENVSEIFVEGNIPFLDAEDTRLMLVDTPGPNNSQNQAHKNTTYSIIKGDSNNLILYVLNGTQLSANDDDNLLRNISEEIRQGGKQARDRFLFVINKADQFEPENESIKKIINNAKQYLSNHGIYDPQIFPCSAFTALNTRTLLKDVDIDNLTRSEMRALPSSANKTLSQIDTFIENEDMHMERYSIVSPTTKKEIERELQKATEERDTKRLALIHCGIYSIEAAITAYVKKYAKTKKIKDLVETFQAILTKNAIIESTKSKIAENRELAKRFEQRWKTVQTQINDGKEAQKFKNKIKELNPMKKIEKKAEELRDETVDKTTSIFEGYNDILSNEREVRDLVKSFNKITSDSIAEMTANLENVIHSEIVDAGEKILSEYQDQINSFDEKDRENQDLNFNTVDLIKDKLQEMRNNVKTQFSHEFVQETVDETGTYEEKRERIKVGEETYVVGTHEELVGYKKVAVGSHDECIGTKRVKVGSHREWAGTRTVKNPKRDGFLKNIWGALCGESKYIDEDVYKDVDDYEDQDVYRTVTDYEDQAQYRTVNDYGTRGVYETKITKEFKAKVDAIQVKCISKLRQDLDTGIEGALKYSKEQSNNMKNQLIDMLDKLNDIIKEKYEELNSCASGKENQEKEMARNQKILKWIEDNQREIDQVLKI